MRTIKFRGKHTIGGKGMSKVFEPKFKPDFKCFGAQYTTVTHDDGTEENCSAYIVNSPEIKSEIFKAIDALPALTKVLEAARIVCRCYAGMLDEVMALDDLILELDANHGTQKEGAE